MGQGGYCFCITQLLAPCWCTQPQHGHTIGCGSMRSLWPAARHANPSHHQVHFIIASCENMVDAKGCRPGDILVASNGKVRRGGGCWAGCWARPGRAARPGALHR